MVPRSGGDGTERPLLEVGRIARPHGLSGEVVVRLVTNRTERLAPGTELTCYLAAQPSPSGSGGAPGPSRGREGTRPFSPLGARTLEVRSSRPFQGRYLVEFEGVHTREAADELRGALLAAVPVEDPEALFVHDLVGSEVVEVDGTRRGTVVAVQANPASDLLVMQDGNLVPLRFVVGREGRVLVVDVPAGLFE
ncbi:MAG: ribosome maturation factor RimM [Acidimicrobiales bacterium]|jgi:16S rRNA processing protein RimM